MRAALVLALLSACASAPPTTTPPTTTPTATSKPSPARPTWAWSRCREVASEAPRTGGGAREPMLQGGLATQARPEVGQIVQLDISDEIATRCTATLVAPNVIITAAHCSSVEHSIADEFFAIEGRDGTITYFPIEEYWTVSVPPPVPSPERRFGHDDIALARLAFAVPAALAVPVGVADRDAAEGEQVEQFGYGCTD